VEQRQTEKRKRTINYDTSLTGIGTRVQRGEVIQFSTLTSISSIMSKITFISNSTSNFYNLTISHIQHKHHTYDIKQTQTQTTISHRNHIRCASIHSHKQTTQRPEWNKDRGGGECE
jgi:hypothetical protein